MYGAGTRCISPLEVVLLRTPLDFNNTFQVLPVRYRFLSLFYSVILVLKLAN
jgi:hypothetical protein